MPNNRFIRKRHNPRRWCQCAPVRGNALAQFYPRRELYRQLGVIAALPVGHGRRLHDTNRTGWWILLPIGAGITGIVAGIILVTIDLLLLGVAIAILGPIIGFLALLGFLMQPSDPGPNRYGSSPLPPRGTGIRPAHCPLRGRTGRIGAPEAYGESGSAPPQYTPSGRRYCPQCGAERASGDARACAVCGAAY